MALRETQAVLEVLLDQDSSVRETQAVLEVALDQASSIRLTQAVLEVLEAPQTGQMFTGSMVLQGHAPYLGYIKEVPTGTLLLEGHGVPYDHFSVSVPVGGLIFGGVAPAVEGTFGIDTGTLLLAGLAPTSLWTTRGDVSQEIVEFVSTPSATSNVSQLVVEFFPTAPATARVSQLVVEILRYFAEPDCPTVHAEGCPTDLPVPLGAAGGTGCLGTFTETPTVAETP